MHTISPIRSAAFGPFGLSLSKPIHPSTSSGRTGFKQFLVGSVAALLPLLHAAPSLAADTPDSGKALHDKHCVACHVKQFGGDGSMVYTRSPRLINNPTALRQRVAFCSAQTGAKLFPDEEEKITAYLAQQFYKFK